MSNFTRDELRVIVCFAGIFGLFVQLLAQTIFGAEVAAGLTGTFGTLATLPVVDSAVEKFAGKRGPTDPPLDPPSSTGGEATPTSENSVLPRQNDDRKRGSSSVDLLVAVA